MSYINNEDEDFKALVGRTVNSILMSEERLTFQTDEGLIGYYVDGDCCSHSYFFDFYGVKNLIGSKVVEFESVELSPGDPGYRPETYDTSGADDYEDIQVYGYRLTTIHPTFGEVSSVFSFRNSSNGYYGGEMRRDLTGVISDDQENLTEDKVGS